MTNWIEKLFRRQIEQHCIWESPIRVGVTRITYVVPGRLTDLAYIRVRSGEDLTANEFVHVSHGHFQPGQIVEVWVQERNGGKIPVCRVGFLPFLPSHPGTFAGLNQTEQEELRGILEQGDNVRDTFYSGAFFRKFMGVNALKITNKMID